MADSSVKEGVDPEPWERSSTTMERASGKWPGTEAASSCWVSSHRDLLARLRDAHHTQWNLLQEKQPTARETVRHWMSLLAPPSAAEDRPTSKDMSAIKTAVNAIIEATDEKILTEEEAAAVTEFLVSRFVERRLDSALRRLFVPHQGWFMGMSGRYTHE